MEEGIKILEKLVRTTILYGGRIAFTDSQFDEIKKAIENLIKGYRELEERNKYLIQYRQALEKDLFENCSNYVISKDKIRKRIKKLEEMLMKTAYGEIQKYTPDEIFLLLHCLKELLEEG